MVMLVNAKTLLNSVNSASILLTTVNTTNQTNYANVKVTSMNFSSAKRVDGRKAMLKDDTIRRRRYCVDKAASIVCYNF